MMINILTKLLLPPGEWNQIYNARVHTPITSVVTEFLRAIAECFARLSHGLGVCPSVCLSVPPFVTPLYCIKTVQAKITKSSCGLSQGYSLSRQNFVPPGEAVPLERGRQRGVPPIKDVILTLF